MSCLSGLKLCVFQEARPPSAAQRVLAWLLNLYNIHHTQCLLTFVNPGGSTGLSRIVLGRSLGSPHLLFEEARKWHITVPQDPNAL